MKNSTRALILGTASDLFYDRGYNLTGINEIIAEAGIAKATLYSHFRSKEELCIAYLKAKDEELLESIEAYCRKKSKGNAQLLGVIQFLVPFFKSKSFNGCWCIRTVAEIPRDNKRIRKQIKENKQAFLGFIEKLVIDNKPALAKKDQAKLSRRIYLLYESAVSESHLHNEDWPITDALEMLKNFLSKKS